VPTTTVRSLTAADEAAAAAALRQYEDLNSSITGLRSSIAQRQKSLFEQHGVVVGADGRAAMGANRANWNMPGEQAKIAYNNSVDQLDALERQRGLLRQQLTEWEQLFGGHIKTAPVDVVVTPARRSMFDRLRSALGRSNKRAEPVVTKAFNWNQRRDSSSRWSGGGAGASKPPSSKPLAPKSPFGQQTSSDVPDTTSTSDPPRVTRDVAGSPWWHEGLTRHSRYRAGQAAAARRRAKQKKPKKAPSLIPPKPSYLTKPQQVRKYQVERTYAKHGQTFAKYSPDQRRDDHGRFADEGKGDAGSASGGSPRWGRRAATAAGLLAAGAAVTPQGRALASAGLLRTAAAARRANLAAMRAERAARRRESALLNARLKNMTDRATLGKPKSLQGRINRADAAAQRSIDRAVSRLPPRARDAVRRELQHGSTGPNPADKLIEFPSWMWPF
jgi:hypothetical protein